MNLTIPVLEGYKILIKKGDVLDFGTPLFETSSQSDYSMSFAQKLGVEPSKIFHYLKKFVGDDIKKGDILAVKKGLFSSVKIKSDYEGKVKEIDHNEGSITISSKGNRNIMHSSVKGEVFEIKDKKITVKVKEGKEYDIKNSSSDFGGKVLYLTDSSNTLSNEIAGNVLVSESISSYNQSKMEALGVTGYVTMMKLPDQTILPTAQLKTIEELKEIMKHIYPYCYIDFKSSKIILYK